MFFSAEPLSPGLLGPDLGLSSLSLRRPLRAFFMPLVVSHSNPGCPSERQPDPANYLLTSPLMPGSRLNPSSSPNSISSRGPCSSHGLFIPHTGCRGGESMQPSVMKPQDRFLGLEVDGLLGVFPETCWQFVGDLRRRNHHLISRLLSAWPGPGQKRRTHPGGKLTSPLSSGSSPATRENRL